jgi:hypothetical protein
VTDDGSRWQAVDPASRDGQCSHDRRYEFDDMAVTVCLQCGADVEPVLAQVLDMRSARRGRRLGEPDAR